MSTSPEQDPLIDELVVRLNLIEAMIAEGRRATGRFGWSFVLWGLVDLAGMGFDWEYPNRAWTWPVVLSIGFVLQAVGVFLLRRAGHQSVPSTQTRACSAIWITMGVTLILYSLTAIFTHQAYGHTFMASICMTVGLAHAASAMLLRWPAQGAVAALWWAGGLACFFVSGDWFVYIFCLEMLFGMVFFGLYTMWLERRAAPSVSNAASAHA